MPPKVFNTEMILLTPTTTKIGGTETTSNGLFSIMVTAVIDTYFNPNITSNCRVAVNHNGNYLVYEIISEPENINMRNRYLQFKVERLKGDV